MFDNCSMTQLSSGTRKKLGTKTRHSTPPRKSLVKGERFIRDLKGNQGTLAFILWGSIVHRCTFRKRETYPSSVSLMH